MSGSGWSHIRYDHKTRPRVLNVVCPSCGAKALACKPSEDSLKGVIVADLSPSFRLSDWKLKCTECVYRKSDVSYIELPKLYLSEGALGIWAWNSDHADCLKRYLKGEDTTSDPYHWFMTYVRGDWKKNSLKAVKELERLHNNHRHCDS